MALEERTVELTMRLGVRIEERTASEGRPYNGRANADTSLPASGQTERGRYKKGIRVPSAVVALIGFGMAALPVVAQSLDYPETRKVEQVDDYHGTKVADPYRWLEDDNSAETKQWVEAENKVTFAYLDKIPYRAQVKQRLEQLFNYPKYSAPFFKGELLFYSKNDGLQNQSVWYVQKGLDSAPEVLLDPNKFSADGTTRQGRSATFRWAAAGQGRLSPAPASRRSPAAQRCVGGLPNSSSGRFRSIPIVPAPTGSAAWS